MTDAEYHQMPLPEAQRALFEEYFSYVYAIVRQKLKNDSSEEDIEECVSDVFADVFLYCDKKTEFNGDLKGMISTIASRKAVSYFHESVKKRNRYIPAEEETFSQIPDEIDIQETIEHAELKHMLRNQINALGEPDASIILHKYYDGMSSVEIAKKVSLSPEAVRMRCSRALKKLKVLLNKEGFHQKGE